MATPSRTHRPRGAVRTLPSYFPDVPPLAHEASLDALGEAKSFFETFVQAASSTGSVEALHGLFLNEAFWKDKFALTFDKRTIHNLPSTSAALDPAEGKEKRIASKWHSYVAARKPRDFQIIDPSSSATIKGRDDPLITMPPTFTRLAPKLATLDVPFSFTLSKPESRCIGSLKLVPDPNVPTLEGKINWKIWILATTIQELTQFPFQSLPLPKISDHVIPAAQRGKSSPQGLPPLAADTVLDALIVGGGAAGLATSISLESAGCTSHMVLDQKPSPGALWEERYKSFRLHHPQFMIQLPRYPVPAEFKDDFMSGHDLGRYMQHAVEELKLPFFGGVEVLSNQWVADQKIWNVKIRDVATGEEKTLKTKNLVLCNGFLVPHTAPLIPKGLEDRSKFRGVSQLAVEYSTSDPYHGKNVVVIGSGNTAHDIAADLASDDKVKSVTILQRSPTVLFDFPTFNAFAAGLYQGDIPVNTADFMGGMMPTGVLRDMAEGAIMQLMQGSEPLYTKLAEKGYMINRKPELIRRAFEERGHAFFFDLPGAFDLVLKDRIKIARGSAVGLVEEGVRVEDLETGEQKTVEADGVVIAAGYTGTNLMQKYVDSGFLSAEIVGMSEDMGLPGVDLEGEQIGQAGGSGHPNLYWLFLGFAANRLASRMVAVQILANVHGIAPAQELYY